MPKKTRLLHETRTLLGIALLMILSLGGWAFEIWNDVDSVQGTIANNASIIGSLAKLEDAGFQIVDAVAVQNPTLSPVIDGGILCTSLATSRESLTDALRLGSTDAYPDLATLGRLNDELETAVFSLGTSGDALQILQAALGLRDVSRQAIASIRTQQRDLSHALRLEWRELLGLLAVCAVCALVLGVCFVTAQRELIRKQSAAEELGELNVALVHAMPGVSRLRPDGTYEFVNQPYAQAVGRTPAELVNQHWESTVAPEDRAAARAGYESMLRDGRAEVELRGLRKDGTTFCEQLMMVSRLDSQGRFIGHHCFMRDITERKHSEERVREAEQRYRTIFEQAGVGVARIDSRTGRFLDINRRYCQIAGREEAEMLGTTFMAITHPDDLAERLSGWDEMLSGKIRTFSMEKRYIRPDHSVVWVNLNVVPLWQPGETPTSHIAVVEDITEKKRGAMELHETNERFRQMAESINEVFWLTDWRDKGILYVSPAYEKVWERTCTSLFDEPQSWDRDIDPEDRPRVRSAFDRDAESGGYDVEYRINCPSGTTRWIRDRAFPIRDERGRVVRMAGLSEDISERKRSEEALRESEERYRLLFERSLIGVFCASLGEGPVDMNPAFVRMFGYDSKEELLSRPRTELYPSQEDREPYMDRVRREGQLTNHPIKLRRKDGTLFEAIENVAILRDENGAERIHGTILDVTQRNQAERELNEQKDLLRSIIDGTDQEICLKDTAGRYLLVNEADARSLGRSPKEVIGMTDAQLFQPEDVDEIRQRDLQVIESGVPTAYEQAFAAPDGTRRVYSVRKFPRLDADGRVTGVIGISSDVTEARRKSDIINHIQQGTSGQVGEAFLEGMSRNLADALGMTFALIGELRGEAKDRVRTISVYPDAAPQRDLEYALAGTPCENVVSESTCCYASGVQERFPGDSRLREMQIESYVGAPLVASNGVVLGLIVVLGRQPVEDPVLAETVLNIFAGRASAELERLQHERAVRDSEQRHRLLIESAPICIHEMTPDGRIFSMNPAGLRLLGLKCEDEVIGQSMFSVVAEQDLLRVTELVKEAAAGRSVEFDFASRAGRIYRKTVVPDLGPDGTARRLIGWASDITDRCLAENALRTSEARLTAVIQNSPGVAVQWYDRKGRIKLWNGASETMFGFTAEYATGKTLDQLIHTPEEFQGFLTALGDIDSSGTPSGPTEFSFHRRNGESGTCLSTMFKIPGDADGDWFVCMDVDITDRKQTEERLRASQTHLEASQRIARIGSWELDLTLPDQLDPNPLRWTDEAYRIFGYEPGEVSPSNEAFWARVHPEDRAKIQEAVRNAIDTRSVYEIDHRVVLPDGSQRVVHERAELVLDPVTGVPQRFVGTSQDISEHRQAEEDVRQREHELAHFARVSVMGELASGLAHEVNQPLTAVVNYCRGARIRLGKRPVEDPELIAAIDDAGREAHRAAEIIRGLARFVQKRDPRQAKIRVNPTIQEAVLLAAAEAKRAKARIELDLALENPNVLADDVQIQQVLLNLVRNGLEAMDRVPTAERVLKVRTAVVENCVRVAVSDCGIGLSRAAQELVFQPFYTTKQEGMGMGLPISRSIIDAHGGRMWVTSNEVHGVTFEFTLPVTS